MHREPGAYIVLPKGAEYLGKLVGDVIPFILGCSWIELIRFVNYDCITR